MKIGAASLLDLYPAEREAIARAVPRRQQEFATGRACARSAMAKLGLKPAAIPQNADRSPHWPVSVSGSISHSTDLCMAVVARRRDCVAVGLDIEPATPLEDSLLETICGARELRWLARRPAGERGLLAKLIFSAKEAAYKCQYTLTGRLFDFHAFRVELDCEGQRFDAIFQIEAGGFHVEDRLAGSYVIEDDHIICLVALQVEPNQPRATISGATPA